MVKSNTSNWMATNGGTDCQMFLVWISGGATPFIKIKAQPKGGVRYATCMLRIKIMANQVGSKPSSTAIGMKIGAHFAPEVEGVDMTNVMDALRSGVTGKIIDVVDEEDGEHVEIYIE